MKQAQTELKTQVIYYNLDMTLWSGLSSGLNIIGDNDIEKEIADIYYEFGHLARKIDAQFQTTFFNVRGLYGNLINRNDLVFIGIIPHLEQMIPRSEKLLALINNKLNKQ